MRSLAELISERPNQPPFIHKQGIPACYDTDGPHTNRFLGDFLREAFQEPFSHPTYKQNRTVKAPYINFKELKSTVTIRAILDRYNLSEGLNERGDALSGRCPICNSESPRCFRVSQGKNCFKCFSCDAGGNILDLVSKIEECSIRDAAIRIVEWFEFQSKESSRGSRHNKTQRKSKPVDVETSTPTEGEEPEKKPSECRVIVFT